MGIAISAQYSVAKLYNDPLLKTSTSLVAGKSGEELEASVATAVVTAAAIGVIQAIVFLCLGKFILGIMGVGAGSEMLEPAVGYLKWRAIGVPAATLSLGKTIHYILYTIYYTLYHTIQHYTTLYNTIPHYTTLYHTIPHYTTPYHTIPHTIQ